MKHRVWGFTALRGPGSPLSSRQRSCEYFLLSDPYLCLKVLLYKPQHASCWIKTSSPAASVTAWLQNFMLLKKRGNLEQRAPVSRSKPQWTPANTERQRGKSVAAGKAARQNNATCFVFFISSHIFSLFIFTPYGVCRMLGEVGGWVQEKEGVGGDDKKARAHKSKQTNRIKPGLKAVRRQRTERQDYDRSSAAQRTAGWWSNTGAAGPPQHVHGGPGARAREKKKLKKAKDNCFCPSVGGSCDHPSCETRTESQSLTSEGPGLNEHPAKGTHGPYNDHPLGRSVTGAPAGRYTCVLWKCKESKDNRELGKRRISPQGREKDAQMSAASVHYGWPKEPALAAHVHTMHTVAKRLSAAKSRACQRLNHSDLQQAHFVASSRRSREHLKGQHPARAFNANSTSFNHCKISYVSIMPWSKKWITDYLKVNCCNILTQNFLQ